MLSIALTLTELSLAAVKAYRLKLTTALLYHPITRRKLRTISLTGSIQLRHQLYFGHGRVLLYFLCRRALVVGTAQPPRDIAKTPSHDEARFDHIVVNGEHIYDLITQNF